MILLEEACYPSFYHHTEHSPGKHFSVQSIRFGSRRFLPWAHLSWTILTSLPQQGTCQALHGTGSKWPVKECLPHCQREGGSHLMVCRILQGQENRGGSLDFM